MIIDRWEMHVLIRIDIERSKGNRVHHLLACNFLPRLFYIICRRALTGIWSLYGTHSLSYDIGSLCTWKLERGRPVPDTWESAADRSELYTYASSLSSEISVLCWRPVLQESERGSTSIQRVSIIVTIIRQLKLIKFYFSSKNRYIKLLRQGILTIIIDGYY